MGFKAKKMKYLSINLTNNIRRYNHLILTPLNEVKEISLIYKMMNP